MLKNMPQRLYQWEGGWVDLEEVVFINRVSERVLASGSKYHAFAVYLKNTPATSGEPCFWSDRYMSEQAAQQIMNDFVQAWANYLSSKTNIAKANEPIIDQKTPDSSLFSMEP